MTNDQRITKMPAKIHVGLVLALVMTQPGIKTVLAQSAEKAASVAESFGHEKQVTSGPRGRILTNTGVWSPDGEWLVYDTRSDAPGESFNGSTIEMVNVK